MLYAVTYELKCIDGPSGSVDTSQTNILQLAKGIAETALGQLDDCDLNSGEWYDLSGIEISPWELLKSDESDEIKNIVAQISDALKADQTGYIDLWEYDDVFRLIEEQDVTSWCSQSLKRHIEATRDSYFELVSRLADEW